MHRQLRRLVSPCVILIPILLLSNRLPAQTRSFAAGALILDDGNGHTVTLQAPDTMVSNYVYTIPVGQAATTGAVDPGVALGQMLYWNGSKWTPTNFVSYDGSAMGLGFASLPATLTFPITLNKTLGPAVDNAINIGDPAHRIDSLFVSTIVGPSGVANMWQRTGSTITPSSSGDSISTSGNISATGSGILSSQAGLSLSGTTSALYVNGNAGATSQVLTSNGPGATPAWTTLTPGSSAFSSIGSGTNTTATMTVGSGASLLTAGGVIEATKFRGAGTTTDAVDLASSEVAGFLSIANGGTGATTATAAFNNLLPSQAGNATKVLGTDGTNPGWVNAPTGTVTSVAVSMPSEFSVSGSPITTTGTISIGKTMQAANSIYAGPATGNGGVPGFRALVSADIPDNAANTTGTAANVTGVVAIANGGTGTTNATTARANLGAAAAGSNSDITSLTGMTTALPINEGGTGMPTLTGANRLLYSTSATALTTLAPGSPNDVLTLNASGVPAWSAPTSTTSITFDNVLRGTNTDTLTVGTGGAILASGGGVIEASKFKGAGTTSDAVDLATGEVAGTLAINHGGTGGVTQAEAINNLLPSQSGNSDMVLGTDGSNVSWVRSGAGTVTSIGFTGPDEFIVSGSPITGSGTIALTKASQSANTIYAGPASGASAAPTFRTLASADIPDNSANTTGTASNVTGIVEITNGGTGSTSAASARSNLGAAASGANSDITALNNLTTALPITEGGTGQTTAAAGFDALSPMTQLGDLIYGSTTGTSARLAGNTSAVRKFLSQSGDGVVSAAPSWQSIGNSDLANSSVRVVAGAGLAGGGVVALGDSVVLTNSGVTALTGTTNQVNVTAATGSITLSTPQDIAATSSPSFNALTLSGDLLLTNTGTATQLKLQGTSTGVSSLKAGAQGATTINYTLPTSQPTANQVLTANSITGSGPYDVSLGWSTPSGGGGGSGWGFSGDAVTSGDFIGTTNSQDFIVKTNSTERLRIASDGKIGIGATSPNAALEVKDGNVLLSNSGTASQLQLQGTGTGTTTFQAGAQDTANIHYTLPTAQGVSGSSLRNNGSGALSWSSVGQVSFGRRTENFNVTSSSLQSDTSLVLTLAANATYTFHAFLSFSDPNAGGVTYAFAFNAPSGSTLKWGFVDPTVGLGTNGTTRSGSGTQSSSISLSGSSEWDIWAQGIVVTGSIAGTLQLRFRKVSGGAGTDPVRLNVNSYLQATRVQ